MTLQEILALGKMGYTKADIDALMGRENAPQETKKEETPKPAEPVKVPEKPAEEKHEPPRAEGTQLDRLFKQLGELTAALQAQNRAAADMGANIIDPRSAGINGIATLSGYEIKEEE